MIILGITLFMSIYRSYVYATQCWSLWLECECFSISLHVASVVSFPDVYFAIATLAGGPRRGTKVCYSGRIQGGGGPSSWLRSQAFRRERVVDAATLGSSGVARLVAHWGTCPSNRSRSLVPRLPAEYERRVWSSL